MTRRLSSAPIALLVPLLVGCSRSVPQDPDAADSVRTRRQALFAALSEQDTTALDTLLRGADSLTATTWRNPAAQAWLTADTALFLWMDRHGLPFEREAFRFDAPGHLWFVGASLAGQRPNGPQSGDTYGMALPGPTVHLAWRRWIASRPASSRPWGAAVIDWPRVVLEPSGRVVAPCSMEEVVATRVLESPDPGYEVVCAGPPSNGTGEGPGALSVVRLDSLGQEMGSRPAPALPSTRLPPGFSPVATPFQEHLDSLRMGGSTVPSWTELGARRCRSQAYADAVLRGDTAALTRLLPGEPDGNCLARAEVDPVGGCPQDDASCASSPLEWTASVPDFLAALSHPDPSVPPITSARPQRAVDSAFARAYPVLGTWLRNHPHRLTAP